MEHIKKADPNEEIQKQLEEIRATNSAIMMKHSHKPTAAVEAVVKRFF
jgi:hypothetical protein